MNKEIGDKLEYFETLFDSIKIECRLFGYNDLGKISNLNLTFWTFTPPNIGDEIGIMGNYYEVTNKFWDYYDVKQFCDIHVNYKQN